MAACIADDVLTMADLVRIIDAYMAEKENAVFERAFAEKYTQPRIMPASYQPTPKDQLTLPWSATNPRRTRNYNH